MEYKGKLYGKVGKSYFPLSASTDEVEQMQEVINFLQWVLRKIDKGDTPEETVRLLLLKRGEIEAIKINDTQTTASVYP